jgi:hypothetical protein
MLAMAKNGWFQRDCIKDTADVCGSVSQCHAPTAVHTDITARRTVTQARKCILHTKTINDKIIFSVYHMGFKTVAYLF